MLHAMPQSHGTLLPQHFYPEIGHSNHVFMGHKPTYAAASTGNYAAQDVERPSIGGGSRISMPPLSMLQPGDKIASGSQPASSRVTGLNKEPISSRRVHPTSLAPLALPLTSRTQQAVLNSGSKQKSKPDRTPRPLRPLPSAPKARPPPVLNINGNYLIPFLKPLHFKQTA